MDAAASRLSTHRAATSQQGLTKETETASMPRGTSLRWREGLERLEGLCRRMMLPRGSSPVRVIPFATARLPLMFSI
jgi:hypothetical protein